MNRTPLLLICIISLLLVSKQSIAQSELFDNLLQRSALSFIQPAGFDSIGIIDYSAMEYEFAIKHRTKNFEVRYAIRPLDTLLQQYAEKEANKKPGDINLNPNGLYATLLKTTTLNISNGYLPEMVVFDKTAVKEEFNADWGGTTYVEIGKEFGKGYKFCMIVAIHKDNVADAYLFFLSDNADNFNDIMLEAFHSLKFN